MKKLTRLIGMTLTSGILTICFHASFCQPSDRRLKYIVQNDTTRKLIVITVDASETETNIYFQDIVCEVAYFDRRLQKIGTESFRISSKEVLYHGEKDIKH